MEELTVNITGMTCGHCVGAVTQALKALSGVEIRGVSVGSATVLYDPARTSPEQIARAIEDAGYSVGLTPLGRVPPNSRAQ